MGSLQRKVIHCPKTSDHPHKKILLLLGHNEINVYCKEHKWLKIQLMSAGEPIVFDNIAAKVTEIKDNTNFELESVPVVAVGEFKSKRKKICQHS
jgi:hypothetical protein